MRVSIIMPTLAEDDWDRHVPSLLGQTYPADEIIVVVDRPTDSTERAALALAWPGLRFVFNDRNLGITRSLNVALTAAQGDIIARADDDDESLPHRLERQLACFESTGADFVCGWGEGVTDNGPDPKPYLIRCPTEDAEIKSALKRRNVLLHPALAFRRDRILALGGYDETFVNAQDYGLYLAGIRAGYTFAAVGEPLVRRHYHAGNISVKRRMNQLMYSCSARAAHHAATGDRKAFLKTLAHYAFLAATPLWVRGLRRRVFGLLGRGA